MEDELKIDIKQKVLDNDFNITWKRKITERKRVID